MDTLCVEGTGMTMLIIIARIFSCAQHTLVLLEVKCPLQHLAVGAPLLCNFKHT